jgi:uncharacterized lipoprotein YddW (UPF0748 family)
MAAAALSALLLASAIAQTPRVIVVQAVGPDGAVASNGPSHAAFVHACSALNDAGVPFLKTNDARVAAKGLGSARIAIFTASRALYTGEAARLSTWLSSGRHAVFVHYLPAEAARVEGWPAPQFRWARASGQYDTMALPADRPFGFPDKVAVRADDVGVTPVPSAALGSFLSSSGQRWPEPALYLGRQLAYVPCILSAAGLHDAGALLRALAGHYDPGLWQSLVPTDASQVSLVDNHLTLAELIRTLKVRSFPYAIRALLAARKAQSALTSARDMLRQGLVDAAVTGAAAARRAANTAFWMAWPSRTDEFRGVWTANAAPFSWQVSAAALAAARVNVVFPYAASASAAYYRSSVLPPAADADGRDWLADAIEACHSRGLKVHVRLLGVSCLFSSAGTVSDLSASGRLMIDDQGKPRRWLCPTIPANRRAIIASAAEVVSKYPVDGVQFDYFRYPDEHCCLCPSCRAAFEEYLGRKIQDWPSCVTGPERDSFAKFRRFLLDGLLGDCRSAILRARPGLPISAAVFVNWPVHRDGIAQDWVAWLDRGLIDFACPMDYTASPGRFAFWAASQRSWTNSGRLCFGIGPYADGVGAFPPLTVAREIEIARGHGEGWVLFSLTRGLVSDHLPALSLGISHDEPKLPRWAGG